MSLRGRDARPRPLHDRRVERAAGALLPSLEAAIEERVRQRRRERRRRVLLVQVAVSGAIGAAFAVAIVLAQLRGGLPTSVADAPAPSRPAAVAAVASAVSALPQQTAIAEPVAAGAPGHAGATAREDLRAALARWIAATNARDFEAQQSFYPPTVEAFYRARNVDRAAVLAEKVHVFGRATVIDLRVGEPDITVEAAGSAATMRFRKRYVIAGPRVNRRGEVLQELRWVKTEPGWQIVSERDVKVLSR